MRSIARNLRRIRRTRYSSPYIRFARTPVRLVYRSPIRVPYYIHHYKPKSPQRSPSKRIATPAFPENSTPAIKEQARLLGLPLSDEEARLQRAELKRLKEKREKERLEEVE